MVALAVSHFEVHLEVRLLWLILGFGNEGARAFSGSCQFWVTIRQTKAQCKLHAGIPANKAENIQEMLGKREQGIQDKSCKQYK